MLQQTWFRAFLIIAITVSLYSFSLGAPFRTLDDQSSIVNNALIRDTKHIKDIFTQGYFNDRSYYRPLVNLSYMAEYQHAKLNPFFYHLDNLILHLFNVFLVWGLVVLLLNSSSLGFWTALIFAVHPIHVEAVSSIAGRSILMGGFGALSAFIFFLLYERHGKRAFLGASLIAFMLGLFSKESTAVLPVVMAFYAWLTKKRLSRLWPFLLIIALYIGLRLMLGLTETFPWNSLGERVLGTLTFIWTMAEHLGLMLVPYGLYFDRSRPIFLSPSEPLVWVSAALMITVIAALYLFRDRLGWKGWFLFGWLALEMFPVSQFITTIGVAPGVISCADHFLYLASVPILIMMTMISKWLLTLNGVYRAVQKNVVRMIVGGWFVFIAAANVEQNIYAADELVMMEHALKLQPANARLQSSVGLIYAQQGDFKKAQEHFVNAVKADINNPRYRISLAKSICDQGRYEECLALYREIEDAGAYKDLLARNMEAAQRLLDQDVQLRSK